MRLITSDSYEKAKKNVLGALALTAGVRTRVARKSDHVHGLSMPEQSEISERLSGSRFAFKIIGFVSSINTVFESARPLPCLHNFAYQSSRVKTANRACIIRDTTYNLS